MSLARRAAAVDLGSIDSIEYLQIVERCTTLEIRDYQQKMVDELVSSPAKTMVQMHTGSGKTALGVYFARRLKDATGSRTLILAHRRELVQQWQDTIVEVGLQSAMVVTIQQLTY